MRQQPNALATGRRGEAGQTANTSATQAAFTNDLRDKAENTRCAQLADLVPFTESLSHVHSKRTGEELPVAWQVPARAHTPLAEAQLTYTYTAGGGGTPSTRRCRSGVVIWTGIGQN